MFDIGGGEFIMLVVLGLLVFGPRRLPQLGRQFGGFVGQMRRAMNDFRGALEREVALDEVKQAAKQVEGLKVDVQKSTRELLGVGPPAPADPTRRLRAQERSQTSGEPAASSEPAAAPEPASPAEADEQESSP